MSMISNYALVSDQIMALRILCLLSLLAFTHAASLPYFDPRIVNGKNAKEGEIPYQVSLQNTGSNFHFCGGSILNDNYVITAAHCVQGKSPSSMQVVAGTINLTQPKSKHRVTKVIQHEGYNSANSWINDIALLKVTPSFKSSANLGHIPLPPKNFIVKAKDVAVVSGWGRLWQGGPSTNQLQRVNIFIADQNYCKVMYESLGLNVFATQICAYDPSVKRGSCHGDSGGPLTVGGKLVGLVSWANGCASVSWPTVYTRVTSYLDWIKAKAV